MATLTTLLLPFSPTAREKNGSVSQWPIGSPVQQQREHHQVAKSHHLAPFENGLVERLRPMIFFEHPMDNPMEDLLMGELWPNSSMNFPACLNNMNN